MKKYLLAAALFLLTISIKAQEGPKNALKLNPVSLLVRTGNISYERAVSYNKSFQLGGFYSGVGLGDFKYEGFGVTPEFRFYFGGEKQALNGGYVAPFARYQNFSITDKDTDSDAKFYTWGGGAIVGWEKNWKSGFLLDIFAGPSYNSVKFKAGAEDEFDIKGGIKGFGLRTGVAIGFTF